MEKDLKDVLPILEREATRLGLAFDRTRFLRDIGWFGPFGRPRAIHSTRFEEYHAWAHSVDILLNLAKEENRRGEPRMILSCRPEISWSATGRSVSMALAAVALYARAIEFAALAETILDGVTVPTEDEIEALMLGPVTA